MTWLKILFFTAAVAVIGIFIRYGSADPCDWLAYDMADKSGLPQIAIRGILTAQFAGENPTRLHCLGRLADLHVNGVEDQLWDP